MGGGTLGAIGSHVVDSFHWMLDTEITKTLGLLSTHIKQRNDKASGESRAVTTDDEAKLLFRFADGPLTQDATASASLSVVESGKYENRLEIYGTKGALMVEETGELWRSPIGSGVWRPVQVDQDHMAQGMRESSWSRGFTAFAVAICDAMQFGKTTVKDAATFEDGHRVQVVLDAIRASNESGCWVTIR
jgi:predicted dehydrogenase